jgi:uncharacterized membrane protein
MSRLRLWWSRLLYTLWFIPAVVVFLHVVLAVVLVEVSGQVDREALMRWPRLFGASAGSSRDMLAAIAGSMITVAGVTFSLTMVAVTQASNQYTPRILRNFMRDRPAQLVLGGLTGVFSYCLVVLRTIRGDESSPYIPAIAVLAAFALALGGVGLLIYFIHHIATSLQASTIVARVSADTTAAIETLFPTEVGTPAPPQPPGLATVLATAHWVPVLARSSGYVQHVDPDRLLAAAASADVVVRMERGVGEFVATGVPIASHAAVDGRPRDGIDEAIAGCYTLGSYRTVEQDPDFGIRQLSDVALKALSPGINDPTTALNCIDYLGAVLAGAAVRSEPSPWREADGVVRVIARGATFRSLLDAAFDEIRRYGASHAAILFRQLDSLALIGGAARDPARRRHVLRHVDFIVEAVERNIRAPSDHGALLVRAAEVRDGLREPSAADAEGAA